MELPVGSDEGNECQRASGNPRSLAIFNGIVVTDDNSLLGNSLGEYGRADRQVLGASSRLIITLCQMAIVIP